MPRLMESYSVRYGLFGVTVALVGWLLCIAVILVVTTVVAAEFDRAPERWARHLRARLGIEQPGADVPEASAVPAVPSATAVGAEPESAGPDGAAPGGASPSEDDPAAPRAGV